MYKNNGGNMTNHNLESIARIELADLYSNNDCSWIEFCDGSVLSLELGELKAHSKLLKRHNNGVSW
jgi:hypothetical protein